ncbi:MAG: hydroxyethylthiazole kinase [candidate division Zixibacteria bacterium RBG_16_53_22]|nr:MAG: hydroxyethylthiazole kinase [candidate division Zixibacteria bacterium RBG_16_53_22]
MINYNLGALLSKVRSEKPLVHNITNYVVMNFTANTLLAMGASPVMAHARGEVEEMVSLAKALVINIGTLSEAWIESMFLAGRRANQLGVPVVLDPVGSGATTLRTSTFKRLTREIQSDIVRGNASEILSIASATVTTKGVDAVHDVEHASDTARQMARQLDCVVAITGPVDLITDGNRVIRCKNGDAMLRKITGTGCAATATIGAFAGVTKDALEATSAGLAFFGLAGEVAAARAKSPGSFMTALLDAMYEITPEQFQELARLEEG